MRQCFQEGEHPTGLAAIRLMLLTGFRRMEVLGLERAWVNAKEHCVHFPDTKSGEQLRAIGRAAVDWIQAQPQREGSPFVFPADWGDGHFVGAVRVLDRVCSRAKLADVTPHTLRHTFASLAGDLGFSELTIAGLLGHAARGVTQNYVHLDAALVVAADQVAAEMVGMLEQDAEARPSNSSGTARKPPISLLDAADEPIQRRSAHRAGRPAVGDARDLK